MDVKITKENKNRNNWYNDAIGKTYQINTEFIDENYFKVIFSNRLIRKSDCKIFRCENVNTKHCINCDIGICDMIKNNKKENKMEGLDFQVNDKVYCLMNGNGIIISACVNEFEVDFFDSTDVLIYTKKGVFCDVFDGVKRTLYHGHDLEVKVTEKKPVRYPWINLKFNPNTKNGTITSRNYNTKKAAMENISNFIKEPWIYIDTIQLIPNNLKGIKEK